jgi:peptidoglycan/xylan/chitin deacetylase (PgdA/CDA1 family)
VGNRGRAATGRPSGGRPASRAWFALVVLALLLAAFVQPSGTAGPARTIVSFTFDDGRGTQTVAEAALASRGMHGTFFVNSNTIGQSSKLTWAQLTAFAADGNEIGGHTLDHVNLTSVSTAEAQRQVCADRDALRSHGFAVVDFAYPYGAVNAAVESIVKGCGYSSARGVGHLRSSACPTCAYAETIPPGDPYLTRAVDDVMQTTTLQQLKDAVTQAEQNGGGWLQFVVHDVCSGCDSYSVSAATLSSFLDWLAPRAAANGTVVETVAQALAGQPPADTTAPVTSIACNGAPCSTAAYPGPVTVTLSASDAGGSGVAATRYTLDGTDPTVSSPSYTGPFTVSATGVVKFRSWDAAGNLEATRSAGITITVPDTVPPVTSIACNGGPCSSAAYSSPVTVTLSASDVGGSGVAATRYTLDGTDPTVASTPYAGPFTVSASGVVRYRSWDAAGNVEVTRSAMITVTVPDTVPPVTSIACNGAPCLSAPYSGTATVTLSASDAGGSGVAATRYTLDGTDPTVSSPSYTTPLLLSQSAVVEYRSWDAAGNVETTRTQSITVEPPPVAGGGGGGGGGPPDPGVPATVPQVDSPVVVRPVLAGAHALPKVPVAGRRFTLAVVVVGSDDGTPLLLTSARCDATLRRRPIHCAGSVSRGVFRVSLVVPHGAGGRLLRLHLEVGNGAATVQQRFVYRVRAR